MRGCEEAFLDTGNDLHLDFDGSHMDWHWHSVKNTSACIDLRCVCFALCKFYLMHQPVLEPTAPFYLLGIEERALDYKTRLMWL